MPVTAEGRTELKHAFLESCFSEYFSAYLFRIVTVPHVSLRVMTPEERDAEQVALTP
jgi:hypothetical protein